MKNSNTESQMMLWKDENKEVEYINAHDFILMSLHEGPFKLICDGKKPYEFRRRWRDRPSVAFIYVTSKVAAICGYVVLGKPQRGSPEEIAKIAENARPGNGKPVYDYFVEQGYGLAIPILSIKMFPSIKLEELRSKFSFIAPQFFSIGITSHFSYNI